MILLDGAAGTTLWEIAEQNGVRTDAVWKYNMEHPEFVTRLHREMIDAGAQIIITNTFAANPPMVRHQSEYESRDVIYRGVELAKEATEGTGVKTALSLGPLPELLEPYGKLSAEETKAIYREMLRAGVEAGADMIFLATFIDLEMMRLATEEARKYPVPVFCMLTFDECGRTIMGQSVSDICQGLSEYRIDGIGMNCSFGPKEALPIIREFAENTDLPIMAKPNAGIPGKIETPERFAQILRPMFPVLSYLGGCCNCNASYIRALRSSIQDVMN